MTTEFKSEYLNGLLYLEPSGEIDHHTAKALREKMDRDIYFYRPRTAVLVLSRISFMDSSGLGLILGRYTKLGDMGSKLKLEDPSDEILKILRLAGVDKLIEIQWTRPGTSPGTNPAGNPAGGAKRAVGRGEKAAARQGGQEEKEG